MNELTLKYGCNANQTPATVRMPDGGALPVSVLRGELEYVGLLDALTGWQLVREMKEVLGRSAAAVCRHACPVGAAVGLPLGDTLRKACFAGDAAGLEDSELACAYVRARGADRLCSFAGWTALSDTCDDTVARLLVREASAGVIAPGYTPRALELLKARDGAYCVLQIAAGYVPRREESRDCFGMTVTQPRNDVKLGPELLGNIVTDNGAFPEPVRRDLLVALVTLKYTPSGAVCCASEGQTIGVGAGQASRICCTRLAGDRSDLWHLRQHPRALALPFLPSLPLTERDEVIDRYLDPVEEDVCEEGNWQKYFMWRPEALTAGERRTWLANIKGASMASDGAFFSEDNIERARLSGVRYIAQPGGSPRDGEIIARCDGYDMVMAFTGARLFLH